MKQLLSFSNNDAKFEDVIVAGSRDFASEENYALLKRTIDGFIAKNGKPARFISGGARGADALGERYATDHQIDIVRFIPNWDKFGKKAGMLRNRDMAKSADALIVFWDGQSKGTRNMIEIAYNLRLEVELVLYENNNNNAGLRIVSAHQQLFASL